MHSASVPPQEVSVAQRLCQQLVQLLAACLAVSHCCESR